MKVPDEFPVAVKQGSCTVKIYRGANKGYPGFKVAYYGNDGRRKVQTFADYDDAHKEAKKKVESLAMGNLAALTLTNDDRLVYLRARSAVDPVGVPLDVAAREYAEAKKLLENDSLLDAVRTYLKSHRVRQVKTVQEVVDEFVHEKETLSKRPVSEVYIKDLRLRLGRFADAFHCEIRSIASEEMRSFLNALKVKGRTCFNYARVIRTLFRFAQARKYYPKDIDPFEGVDLEFADDGEIEIFSPEELSRLFQVARAEIIPFLALGAFAGLRHMEITRLDWQEVLPSGYIEIKKSKAKVRSRRLVPITENLAIWLANYRQAVGPVCAFANMSKQLLWLAGDTKEKDADSTEDARRLEVKWKHNALRHSFISYRLAIVGDENKVAMEAGNSPAMIYRNYRQLVTKEQAERWFAIVPIEAGKIISLQAVAANVTRN
jgi:integrase